MQKTLRKAKSWAEMGGSLQCSAKTQELRIKQTGQQKHVVYKQWNNKSLGNSSEIWSTTISTDITFINLAWHLDSYDFNSETLLIHVANLQ